MADSTRWVKAAEQLLELTRSDKVTWRISDRLVGLRENVIGHFYMAEVKSQTIGVYEYKYRHLDDDLGWVWLHDIAIEFVSAADGRMEWTWPETSPRYPLLEAIRFQTVGAEQFLDEFLESDEPKS